MIKKILILILFFLAAIPAQAKTTETILSNGLKLIVKEDHRAPVVVSQIWYKIGSSYEHGGVSGLSHALEHMMFKGTQKLKPGEFSEIIAANGGKENAFTSQDYTAYFQRIAADRLELCLELEADRMRNVVFLQKEFDKEIAVVQEERSYRVDNKPKSKLYEQFYATAFLTSPVRIPTIGWMQDLKGMQMDDAASWYKKWYAPNNATLIIVGDVETSDVQRLVEKHFGHIQPSVIKPPKLRPEIAQNGERRIQMYGQTANPYVVMGYKVPVLNKDKSNAKEVFALDVLSGILDGGSSARISSKLLRGKEWAAEAGASYGAFERLNGLFIFAGTPNKGIQPTRLEQAFTDEIALLQQHKVTDEELNRVKAQVIASKVYERDSMFYMAMQIGTMESMGYDWRLLESYVDDIKSVTAEDVINVAKKYFDRNQLTVATLLPESKGE